MFEKLKEIWREAVAMEELQQELTALIAPSELKALLTTFKQISKEVDCPHNPSHILSFVTALLKLRKDTEGYIVEAGCFKGGSTAKISLVAKSLGRRLVIFDSFEGLPENTEAHDHTIHGGSIKGWFEGKEFCGSLDEVKRNVAQYGDISVCTFVEGWFDDTMPDFSETVCAAYLDVDLASSTKTCLKYLYPRITPGGVLMSQDGDFPLVIKVFSDTEFWKQEVGVEKPTNMEGLGTSKMLSIVKPERG